MINLKLDSILLFALAIPFIMTYRISPFVSQYWYFGLIFLGLLLYLLSDLFLTNLKNYNLFKNILLWILIALIVGGSFVSVITIRHKTHPIYQIHDIILQQEAAIQFLVHDKNPYALTYFGTFLEQWHYHDKEINPALYHFVMEPFYLIFALPFYYISNHTIGYFDARIPLFFLFSLMLILAFLLVRDQEKRREFVVLLALNPAMLPYTLEGRSDMFMYAFLFITFYFLYKKRYALSGIFAALAFTVKQSAWPIFPFYVVYIYFKTKNIKRTFFNIIPFSLIFTAITLPFLLWNPKSYIDSTIGYLNGSVLHSYPVSGYGLGAILLELNIIKDKFAYYPFSIWQLAICIPLLIVLIIYLKESTSVQRLIAIYGVFLFVYWYLARYFNNSHLAYLSMIIISAYFWPIKDENENHEK
jgi:uncharacterized membrane protein